MTRYISNPDNLKLMMNMLKEKSRNIQFEAFHVFKVCMCVYIYIYVAVLKSLTRNLHWSFISSNFSIFITSQYKIRLFSSSNNCSNR